MKAECPYCGDPTMKMGKMWLCGVCKLFANDVDTFTYDSKTHRLPQLVPKGVLLVRKEKAEK